MVEKVIEEIFLPLQAVIKNTVVPRKSLMIGEDGRNIGSSMLKILNGTFDMRVRPETQRFIGDFWRNELNLFIRSGICYAIADDKKETWNEYFLQNCFLHIFVSTLFICLIIETIMNHFCKRNIGVTMDLLRASIGNATLWEPKASYKRMIFLLIIFSFMIVTSFLQSELTSLIAVKSTKELKIEKIDDLINNGYEVSATSDISKYFISTPFYHQIRTPHKECYEVLEKNFSACAHDCYYLKNTAHLPENTKIYPDLFLQGYFTYIFPVDYPLLPQIRNIYSKLYESGLVFNIYKQNERKRTAKNETIDDVTMNELEYVFYFQAFGFSFAVIVFLIEVCIAKLFKCH